VGDSQNIVYSFDCPWHGPETAAFCWRAFSDDMLHRWRKFEITRVPVRWEQVELEQDRWEQVGWEHGERKRVVGSLRDVWRAEHDFD
jgi:hypothetical protein